MLSIKRFFGILFFIFCFSNFKLDSQTYKLLLRPEVYNEPKGQLAECHNCVTKGFVQIVYSDRANNDVYDSPESLKVIGKLGFGEAFYAIGEKGSYLQLIKYEGATVDKGRAKNATEVGWVKKDHLLFWSTALRSEVTSFVVKAFTIVKGDVFKNINKYINENTQGLKFYNNPVISLKNVFEEKIAEPSKLYYVFKEDKENNSVLLASEANTNPERPYLIGWASLDAVQVWDSRLCLQPNYEPVAEEERRTTSKLACVFIDKDDAIKYRSGGQVANSSDSINVEARSKDGKVIHWTPVQNRMPVLEDDKANKVYFTGFTTKIADASGNSSGLTPEYIEALNKRRVRARTINIVFLIDGSNLAIPKGDITQAIEKIKAQYGPEKREVYELNFGAVFYGSKESDIKKQNLTLSFDDVTNFISEYQSNSDPNSDSKNLKEGMQVALKQFTGNGRELNTNLLIIVGGIGDKEDISSPELVNLYSKVSANAVAYQFNSGDASGFRKFLRQTKGIMDEGNLKMLNDIKEGASEKEIQKINDFKWEEINKEDEDIYAYKILEDKSSLAFGEITFPPSGKSLDNSVFIKEMENILNRIAQSTQQTIEEIDKSLLPQKGEYNISNRARKFLKGADDLIKGKEDFVKVLAEGNYQFFGECYAPRKAAGAKEDAFERVLFFTSTELIGLSAQLTKLAQVEMQNREQTRKELYNAMFEIIKGYFGEKEAKEQMKKMSGEELIRRITGVDPISPYFRELKSLDDVLNEKRFDNTKLDKLAGRFQSKAKEIARAINEDSYKWVVDRNVNYYWIPERLLP